MINRIIENDKVSWIQRTDGYREKGVGRLGKQVKELRRSTDWQLQDNHGDVKHNLENIVNKNVKTMVAVGY